MVTQTKSTTSLIAAFDDYLKYGTDDEEPKVATSRRAYCWTVERFLRFLQERQPTPALGKAFVKELEEQGNAPSSINRHIWALKSYFRFRKETGIPGAEELKIRGLKTISRKPRFVTDKEWPRLVKVATDAVYDPEVSSHARLRAKLTLALLYVYAGGGLRLSEAVRLVEEDIIEDRYLRVLRKGGREDFVPVEDEVVRVLRDWLESKPPNGRFIFPGKGQDSPLAPRTAQGIVKQLCMRAGLPDVHVHSLRHTAGYQLRKAGASERDIQDVLGHKNINTTSLYTNLVRDDLRRRLPKRFASARQAKMDWK
ncbi:hypothetical protein LCGC14_0555010 [marine sediment metagenome]|uniref:Tyr recombinase domain-containing protein n=1 Tax=marine sediment metagenome TaxID=412755 RepID=A0A0F9RNM0_9ZZZZ